MLGLLAIGSIIMADSAQDVLRKAREDYYKQQKEGARPAKGERKEKVFEKLKKDSEVRWHRDKYKKVLNNYDTYYKNIAKMIREKEQKIAELEAMLSVMN